MRLNRIFMFSFLIVIGSIPFIIACIVIYTIVTTISSNNSLNQHRSDNNYKNKPDDKRAWEEMRLQNDQKRIRYYKEIENKEYQRNKSEQILRISNEKRFSYWNSGAGLKMKDSIRFWIITVGSIITFGILLIWFLN